MSCSAYWQISADTVSAAITGAETATEPKMPPWAFIIFRPMSWTLRVGRAEADGLVGAAQVGHLGGEEGGEGQVDEELVDAVDSDRAVDGGPEAV